MQHIFLIFSCLFAIINTPQWQMMPIVACRGFFCVRSEPLCAILLIFLYGFRRSAALCANRARGHLLSARLRRSAVPRWHGWRQFRQLRLLQR